MIANLSISILITMGSSCARSIGVEWVEWMARRCFFLAELEHPPRAKPLAIVLTSRPGTLSATNPEIMLITSWTLCLVRLFLSRLSLRSCVLLTGLSLCLSLVGCWLSYVNVILLAWTDHSILFVLWVDIDPSVGIDTCWYQS